jgi:hypothetical protein
MALARAPLKPMMVTVFTGKIPVFWLVALHELA